MSAFIPVTDHHVVAVDAWSPPQRRAGLPAPTVAAHFLTHAHGDHMQGLGDAWAGALGEETPIYCSFVTAAAVASRFPGLAQRCVRVGPGGRVAVTVQGVTVAVVDAVDAAHCAGSLMLLVRSPACGTVLHTGDCRIETDDLPRLTAALAAAAARDGESGGPPAPPPQRGRRPVPPIDVLLLDNTFCHPSIAFPPRRDVVAHAIAAARARPFAKMFVVADMVGKEELLAALAAALGVPCGVASPRAAVVAAAGFPPHLFEPPEHASPAEGASRLTAVPRRALGPVVEAAVENATVGAPVLLLVPSGLSGLRPGWWRACLSRPAAAAALESGALIALELPYSLHAGFDETVALVAALRPRWVAGLARPRGGDAVGIDPGDHLPSALAARGAPVPRFVEAGSGVGGRGGWPFDVGGAVALPAVAALAAAADSGGDDDGEDSGATVTL